MAPLLFLQSGTSFPTSRIEEAVFPCLRDSSAFPCVGVELGFLNAAPVSPLSPCSPPRHGQSQGPAGECKQEATCERGEAEAAGGQGRAKAS